MGDENLAAKRPFEGHFVVGGSGLYVSNECLGRTFTSHTARFELTIGLPQIDDRPDLIPPEIRERLGEPPIGKRMDLIPPQWAYGPTSESDRKDEEHMSPVWGGVIDDGQTETVYPESSRNSAVVVRCRFYTTFPASGDSQESFDSTSAEFLAELDDWWTRFTLWVGILSGQDFVGLGGNAGGITQGYPIFTWTGDQNGQRARVQWRYIPSPHHGAPQRQLRLSLDPWIGPVEVYRR